MPPTARHEKPPAQTPPKATRAINREFHAPWSMDVLRILHGTACIACRMTRGQLYPAGTAVSIGPSGDTIRWDVRQCATCAKGTAR